MKRSLPAIGILLFSGCSMKTIALRSTAALMRDGAGAFRSETDPKLAREAMASQLKMTDALLLSEPGNEKLLLLASQGYGGYAFLFLEDTEPERAKDFYQRGRDYGLRLLGRNKEFNGIRNKTTEEIENILKKAATRDVPALFWSGYSWAGWINISRDDMAAVAELSKAVLLMRRVAELNPAYYFGGADLFFGGYYASRPKMLGGDPDKAKTHFEAAAKRTEGKFLMGHLLQARYQSIASMDRELFDVLIEKVLEGKAGALAEAGLTDAVAKEKAKALKEKADDLF